VTSLRFGTLIVEWDEQKAQINRRKHRVTFEEAATAFLDPLARLFDDPDRSSAELRFLLIGRSLNGRVLLVAHVDRAGTIRIISARRPTERERRAYEDA
jgi:uncharacterized DUF497 family protein